MWHGGSFNIHAYRAGSEYAYAIKPAPTFKITQTDCESARCVGALLNASHACGKERYSRERNVGCMYVCVCEHV